MRLPAQPDRAGRCDGGVQAGLRQGCSYPRRQLLWHVAVLDGQSLTTFFHTDISSCVAAQIENNAIQNQFSGGTISGTGGKRVITILNGGSVTLTGSTVITGGGASGGAGVFVGNGSTFNMEGGEISGNSTKGSNQGGGVLVEGTFNMSGGTIKDNTSASHGGGVAVNNGTVVDEDTAALTGFILGDRAAAHVEVTLVTEHINAAALTVRSASRIEATFIQAGLVAGDGAAISVWKKVVRL